MMHMTKFVHEWYNAIFQLTHDGCDYIHAWCICNGQVGADQFKCDGQCSQYNHDTTLYSYDQSLRHVQSPFVSLLSLISDPET